MALIYFYDASDLDTAQLNDGMTGSDHHWEFINDTLNDGNINPDAEVISVFVSSAITREHIEKMPNLRLIACRSTGFNNIDLRAAEERNITVANVPTYGESTVAEYAFTLLLALMRKLPQALEAFDNNSQAVTLTGNDLHGKTIGVIGTGHIGMNAVRIARGFGMNVVAYDLYPKEDMANELNFQYVSFDELITTSDVVTIHAPYTKANHHLLSQDVFEKMKPSAVIINTARGELIDTNALTTALSDGLIAGAGLDVVENEKLLQLDEEIALLRADEYSDSQAQMSVALMALHKMPNVIVTPHNAFNTTEAIGRINATTCQNILGYWYGDVPNLVQKPVQEYGKLLLVRHAESEWNATGQWTGITDVHLSQKGFHESALLGIELHKSEIIIDTAYCSEQIRTLETLEGILNASRQLDVPIERIGAINERDYGDYTGKNKWEVKELVGEEEFHNIRRGWNHPVPNGESLKDVYDRAVPFYIDKVVVELSQGKNVLIVAHGNSIRALIKYIENLSDSAIEELEMMFGKILLYDVSDEGRMLAKTELQIDSPPPNA